MATQAKVRRAKPTKALTKAEAAVLGRLDTLKSAARQAEHAHEHDF